MLIVFLNKIELYIPSQNGINNGLTEEDISNTEENCKNFNINLSRRKTGGEETKKDVAVLKLEDDNTLTTTARRYKACQSSSVNYERQTQPEDEKDSSLQQHVRVPAESDKVAPKIAGSFGKKSEFDKIDEARRVKEETTGPMLSGEKERRINNLTEMSSKRKTLPRKESLYQKQSVVGTTRKVNMRGKLLIISIFSFNGQISREDSYIVMEQSQDFKQKFRLTNSDLEKLIELGY